MNKKDNPIIALPDASHQSMLNDTFNFGRETKVEQTEDSSTAATFEVDGKQFKTSG